MYNYNNVVLEFKRVVIWCFYLRLVTELNEPFQLTSYDFFQTLPYVNNQSTPYTDDKFDSEEYLLWIWNNVIIPYSV